ncbi:hypothetical protein DL93DRAFT_1733542 [Clavulina sp. PMI_390]|nr:hypothetical protein DL93DRAFT_1733542 [Clavulina sp. PMI_390]
MNGNREGDLVYRCAPRDATECIQIGINKDSKEISAARLLRPCLLRFAPTAFTSPQPAASSARPPRTTSRSDGLHCLPIIKSLYLMKAAFTLKDGASGDIRFGVWGECVYGVSPTDIGFTDVNFFGSQCTHRGLGLTTRVVDTTQVADVMFAGASWSLVLHPVACGAIISGLFLLIVVWMLSLTGLPNFMYRRGERMGSNLKEFISLFASLFPLGMILTSSILTTACFFLDVIIVGSGISRAHDNPQAHTKVTFGAVPWLTFIAMLLTWVGVVEAYRSSFSFAGRK